MFYQFIEKKYKKVHLKMVSNMKSFLEGHQTEEDLEKIAQMLVNYEVLLHIIDGLTGHLSGSENSEFFQIICAQKETFNSYFHPKEKRE